MEKIAEFLDKFLAEVVEIKEAIVEISESLYDYEDYEDCDDESEDEPAV